MLYSKLKQTWNKFLEIWPLLPAAIFLVGFLIVVAVSLVFMSLSGADGEFSFYPAAKVFSSPDFRLALVNTLLFVIAGTPLELAVGLFFAVLLYKSFLFRNAVRGFFIIPLAVPALVTATLLFILFDYPGGHINHFLTGRYVFFPAIIREPLNWRASSVFSLGISLAGKVWRDMPISMLILLAGLNSIDPELLDAASTLGAGMRRRFRYIILPLIMPSISAVVLLRSIEMWKEFIFPFVLAGRHNLLGTLIESLYNNWGKADQAAVVAIVLVACIVLCSIVLFKVLDAFRNLLVRI